MLNQFDTPYDNLLVATFSIDPDAYSHLCDVITAAFKEAFQVSGLMGYAVGQVNGSGATSILHPGHARVTFVSVFLNSTYEETVASIAAFKVPIEVGADSCSTNPAGHEGYDGNSLSRISHVRVTMNTTMRELARSAVTAWISMHSAVLKDLDAHLETIVKPALKHYRHVRVTSHQNLRDAAMMEADRYCPDLCATLDAIAHLFEAHGDDVQYGAAHTHEWSIVGVGIVHQYSKAGPGNRDISRMAECMLKLPYVGVVEIFCTEHDPDLVRPLHVYRRSE